MAKKNNLLKALLYIAEIILVAGAGVAYWAYNNIMASNVQVPADETKVIYVHSNDTLEDVLGAIRNSGTLKDYDSFAWTANLMKYGKNGVKGGRYVLKDGMSNRQLVRMLASGNQTAVKLTFNNIRTINDLAGRLSQQLEMDSLEIISTLNNPDIQKECGVDAANIIAIFIPNTYEMYWNISPEKLVKRMKKEYDGFWNETRTGKLARTGLTQLQVSALAAIVEEETIKKDEQPIVAGLYINRLKKGMKLESDPTVKFAVGDFSLRRIWGDHLKIDSPYNTYMYEGLTPSPIRIPSISALDAVLNYREHNYIFMCAKEDFSGYHNFAITGAEHAANAKRYHNALDARGIR